MLHTVAHIESNVVRRLAPVRIQQPCLLRDLPGMLLLAKRNARYPKHDAVCTILVDTNRSPLRPHQQSSSLHRSAFVLLLPVTAPRLRAAKCSDSEKEFQLEPLRFVQQDLNH